MNGESTASQPASVHQEIPPDTVPQTTANADEFLKGIKLRFVDLLAAGEPVEFIVDFLEAAVPQFVSQIQNFPPDRITAFFAQDPILARVVAQPEWPEWLREARAYLNEEDSEPALASHLKN